MFHHGERLDRALALLLPEFSRSFSQQLLSEGCVSCVMPTSRVMSKASAKVRMGERYQLILKPTPQAKLLSLKTFLCTSFTKMPSCVCSLSPPDWWFTPPQVTGAARC